MGCKDRSTIGNDRRGEAVLAPDVVSKQLSCRESVFLLSAWDKYGFFGELIDDYQNIVITEGFRHLGKVYCNILPGTLGYWQR